MRRDVELSLAMGALRAATEKVAYAAASLMRDADPGRSAGTREGLLNAAESFVDTGILVKDIRGVAHQLDAVESALSKTARHVRRQDA